MPSDTTPEQPDGDAHVEADDAPDEATPSAPIVPAPTPATSVLATQSREDTDVGWGEYGERDDDRLLRDRPPHWDNA